jgi:hypothetical protein
MHPRHLPLLVLLASCVQYGLRDEDTFYRAPVSVTETFRQEAAPKVDILWVIDNTGSMSEEQEALAESFAAFIEALEGESILWQLGVITTDVSDDQAGRLQGNPWIITSDAQDPESDFRAASSIGTSGSPPEAGFWATMIALSPESREGPNLGFRRDDAVLHVIVVSDDDDASDDFVDGDPTEAFLAFAEEERARVGLPVLFSAVAGDTPVGCHGSGGAAQAAERYARAVEALGGAFESLCSPDFLAIETALGAQSVVWNLEFPLQAEAYQGVLLVSVDGTRVTDGWSYRESPPTLVFAEAPPPESVIVVRYVVDDGGGL